MSKFKFCVVTSFSAVINQQQQSKIKIYFLVVEWSRYLSDWYRLDSLTAAAAAARSGGSGDYHGVANRRIEDG